jgi:hypothetical protein
MSASMMEKVKLCGGNIIEGDIATCPYASKLVDLKDIPTFFGGPDESFSAILDPERRAELHGEPGEHQDDEHEVSTPDKSETKTPKSKSSKKKKKKK